MHRGLAVLVAAFLLSLLLPQKCHGNVAPTDVTNVDIDEVNLNFCQDSTSEQKPICKLISRLADTNIDLKNKAELAEQEKSESERKLNELQEKLIECQTNNKHLIPAGEECKKDKLIAYDSLKTCTKTMQNLTTGQGTLLRELEENKRILKENQRVQLKNNGYLQENQRVQLENNGYLQENQRVQLENKEVLKENQRILQEHKQMQYESSALITKEINTTKFFALIASGAVRFSTGIYFFHKTSKTWQEAREFCQSRGMDLVAVESEEEQDALAAHYKSLSWSGHPWTSGCYVNSHGGYVWLSTGQPVTYTKWWPGDPNGNTEQYCICITFTNNGWWDDHKTLTRSLICEL